MIATINRGHASLREHTANDVLAYRERRAATRREALRDLTQVSEELGLYDG